MRNECNIIRDILPLYAENMVSSDTADFVEEHLKSCEACRKEYEQTKEPKTTQEISAAPLLKLSRKMKIKRIQTIALTALFVITLLVSAYAVLTAPLYLPYSEELITVEPVEDIGLHIVFDKSVTNYDCKTYLDPDGGHFYYCDIQAWTSLWDKWFLKGEEELSTFVLPLPLPEDPEESYPIIAEYLPNTGSETVCVYGNMNHEGQIVLPRLSLGFYSMLAVAALVVSAIVWFLTRKKANLRVWVERVGLYPVSYLISHCIVSNFRPTTYSLPRDFLYIVFISVLLYSVLLLAYNTWRLKKEIKESNPMSVS